MNKKILEENKRCINILTKKLNQLQSSIVGLQKDIKTLEDMRKSFEESIVCEEEIPKWIHDCSMCEFVGFMGNKDVYICRKDDRLEVVIRYSSEGSDYWASFVRKKWERITSQYIIVETVFGHEYKIALISHRFISDTPMYMLLADTYYVGDLSEVSSRTARVNKFVTFKLAEQAVQELETPIGEEKH